MTVDNIEDIYELTPLQQGMLYHTLYAPQSGTYFEQFSYQLEGAINSVAMRLAWQRVLDATPVLRSAIVWEEIATPVQVVYQQIELPWSEEDWRDIAPEQQKARLDAWLLEDRQRGFELTQAPLLRLALIRCGEQSYHLVWSFHHILLDGWSVALLLAEVLHAYTALCQKGELSLQPRRAFRDYIVWLQERNQQAAESYWKKMLEGLDAPTSLGIGAPRPVTPSVDVTVSEQKLLLPLAVTRELEDLAREQQVTLNTLMQGMWALLLSRYSGERRVIFGITVAGRPPELAGVERMIGMFINTLPLVIEVAAEQRLNAWLQGVQATNVGLRQYEQTPLVQVQEWSQVPRGQPLFESLLVFENYPEDIKLPEGEGALRLVQAQTVEQTNYPLTLMVVPGKQLQLRISYERERFEDETIERLLGHCQQLLGQMLSQPCSRLAQLSLLSQAERQQVLYDWNQTSRDYPRQGTVPTLFQQQVNRTPDRIALCLQDTCLTYAELNARANQLAHYLQRLGVGPEVPVGLYLHRSLELPLSILAILKAGGVYVPLDLNAPASRLAFLQADTGFFLLISQPEHAERLASLPVQRLWLKEHWERISTRPTGNLRTDCGAEHLAYIMYTSGSTGLPKGTGVSHRNVLRLVLNTDYICFGQEETWLLFASPAFDVSTLELWGPLLHGSRLQIGPAALPSLAELGRLLQETAITTLWLTAGLFHQMVDAERESLAGVRQVIAGGDVLSPTHVRSLLQCWEPGTRWLINGYGPTEATTFSCCYPMNGPEALAASSTVPIGRPIANTQLYILDEGMEPTAIGVVGELYIGGEGVARGYHGRPELTAERFVPHPFSQQPGERLYRTGDLTRYRSDGVIEFLGRRDNQVKLRGFRVELAEIEEVLKEVPEVQDALVVVQKLAAGEKRLLAYVVAEQERVSVGQVRAYLRERLPDYMVPASITLLTAFPLNASGKIDRKALPEPNINAIGSVQEHLAPRTPVEEVLAGMWERTLHVERVSVNDNFFELGGHSLQSTQLVSAVRATFHIDLSLQEWFQAANLAALAERIEQARQAEVIMQASLLQHVETHEPLPLSFGQQRLWFLEQLDTGGSAYIIRSAVRLSGQLDFQALRQSFYALVQRHSILRTTFTTYHDQPVQIIHPDLLPQLRIFDLQELSPEQRDIRCQEVLVQVGHEPFDLERGPLLRLSLLRLTPTSHILALALHHIIADGWSMGVLFRELATLYIAAVEGESAPLPPLELQYADYALWQREWLQGPWRAQQLEYWRQQLAGAPEILELPTDRPRPPVQSFAGANYRFDLPAEVVIQLRELSRQEECTLFMTLLAAFQTLLLRYSNQNDIVVGTPIANRTRGELEDLIGFFVNTLPLRCDLSGNPTFRELLERVRETCLSAYIYQDMPFEQIIDELNLQRDPSYSPLFQVAFALQNTPSTLQDLPELSSEFITTEGVTAKFDLTLFCEEVGQGIQAVLEYNTDLFDAATIQRMAAHFQQLLAGIIAQPEQRLATLPLLHADEQQQILYDWNSTFAPYPRELCIHELFATQVQSTPDAVAALFGDEQVTYLQLKQRANQIAHYLRARGCGPDTLVGIFLERSVDLIVAILGVLQAGAAYLPLDPVYPSERIAFILQDAHSSLLLTSEKLLAKISSRIVHALCLDSDAAAICREEMGDLTNDTQSEHAAYVMYTSGSTGQPKGIVIPQRAISRLVCNTDYVQLTAQDRIAQASNAAFDAATFEIWSALLHGGCLVGIPTDVLLSPDQLATHLRVQAITTLFVTTALFNQVVREKPHTFVSVRRLLFGGEAVDPGAVKIAYSHGGPRKFVHVYGPTESTTFASWYPIDYVHADAFTIPIGRPIRNTQLYILDDSLQPAPIGVPGELYIGGDGLARGYLHCPDLTAGRFLPDLFCMKAGARMYRTGDEVRSLPDGNIVFLRRRDNQVKIRGFRIELGEIESLLVRHPAVRDAVVIASSDGVGSKRLVAYVVPHIMPPPSENELSEHLTAHIPAYMIPSMYMFLEALPLTPNGKIDRRALPRPTSQPRTFSSSYQEPRTPVEQTLAQIWSQVLGVPQVGIHDNFFTLGGDSILSIQVISRAHASGLHLTPRQLFQQQTIAQLAPLVSSLLPEEAASAALWQAGPVPLTPIQRWFFAQPLQHPEHFNQALLLCMPEAVSSHHLQQAMEAVSAQHDVFTLCYEPSPTGWQQIARPSHLWEQGNCEPLLVVDLSRLAAAEQSACIAELAREWQGSLHLQHGPLWRMIRFGCGPQQEDRLLLLAHHLLVDGVSWRILLDEVHLGLSQLVQGQALHLPAASTSFQHWARHLSTTGLEVSRGQADFWLRQARQVVPALPRTSPAGSNLRRDAQVYTLTLGAPETEALLRQTPRAYRTRIDEVLLVALLCTLSRWSGSRRVRLALEGHGREEAALGGSELDLSRTVGWCTALYPLVLQVPAEGREDLGAVLRSVKEQVRQVPQRGVGYGLLRWLAQEPEVRTVLEQEQEAEVSFNYLGQFDQSVQAQGWTLAPEVLAEQLSPQDPRGFLLEINAVIAEGCLTIGWWYSREIHTPAHIEALAQNYAADLRTLLAYSQQQGEGRATPSDFPLARVSQQVLERLEEALGPWPGERAQIEALYPLTPLQQGMLYHSLAAPHAGMYVEQLSYRLEGVVDGAALRAAWEQVVQQTGVLRSVVLWEGVEQPVQVVLREQELAWREEDWRGWSEEQQEHALQEALAAERAAGFALERGPLQRWWLIRLGERRYHLLWSLHHILLDGWSVAVVLGEVMRLYEGLRRGEHVEPEQRRSFEEYVQWLAEQDVNEAQAYWRGVLEGVQGATVLAAGSRREAVAEETAQQATGYRKQELALSREETQRLEGLAREQRVTVNTLVQGMWALLLSRYSGERRVIFGVTVAGRPPELAGVERMIGMFINTLPLVIEVGGEQRVDEWLQGVQASNVGLRQYEQTPLVQVQEWSQVPRGQSLFESLLVFENYPEEVTTHLQNVSEATLHSPTTFERTNYPITLVALPGKQLRLSVSYECERFEDKTIERLLGHCQQLLGQMLAQPCSRLAQLSLLSQAERQQVLYDWNQTSRDYPRQSSLPALFQAQVARTPDRVALCSQDACLTYVELNARANQLARYLQRLGVGPEVPVGLYLHRSLELPLSILAILKAGGVYVPLDLNAPASRLAFLQADTGFSLLISQPEHEERLTSLPVQPLLLKEHWTRINACPAHELPTDWQAEQLAYIMYTSGSTGLPKGTGVSHRNVLRLVLNTDYASFGQEETWLLFASPAFDASTLELWGALLHGSRLVIVPAALPSLAELGQLLQEAAITSLWLTAGLFHQMVDAERESLASVRQVLAGGDILSPTHVRSLLQSWEPGTHWLINGYGPTEATTFSCCYRLPGPEALATTSTVPIGRPIANTQVYILDEWMEPTPVGLVGELYIGGEGVARGYQGRPELTAEWFVPHPFSQQPGERLYRTGDLTRYGRDGTIEFLGRRDNQVKLRGFRIELGEIETVLKEAPEVQDALVVVQELTAGEKRLLAYVVAEQDEVSVEQVRAHLRERLPDYMVPASITPLTAFPLNANGKIDRKALLELTAEQNASSDAIMLARDSVELRLVQIWEEVLNTRPISITEDFFSLGGHSLMIVAMMAQIRQHFNQQLSPAVIFQAGTVEKLAHLLRQRTDRASWTPIVPIQPHGTKPPFFCVHPGTGSIFSFLHLARHLGADRPFYGIQARGIDGEQEPLTRIEDMATCYIEALRLIQPEGPYYLGGHSLGGMIAFEMAHQLHAQGQDVAFLGVIDTTPPVIKVESVLERDDTTELIEFMQVAARFFGIDLEITYEELHQLEPEQQLQLAQSLLHNHLLTTQGDISLLRNYLTVQKAHSKCMHYYQPRPYTGEVTLFRAATVHPYEYQDEYAAIFDDPLLGWGPFSAKPVEVHVVPGDHISMMVEPHVQTLAERLRNCLDKVQAQSGRASIG